MSLSQSPSFSWSCCSPSCCSPKSSISMFSLICPNKSGPIKRSKLIVELAIISVDNKYFSSSKILSIFDMISFFLRFSSSFFLSSSVCLSWKFLIAFFWESLKISQSCPDLPCKFSFSSKFFSCSEVRTGSRNHFLSLSLVLYKTCQIFALLALQGLIPMASNSCSKVIWRSYSKKIVCIKLAQRLDLA